VDDPTFYRELYAAIESNLRGSVALETVSPPPSQAVVTDAAR
jgi:hypothetical protein